MNPQTRNFSEIKSEKQDEEGVSTVTSQEQVILIILWFTENLTFYFYFGSRSKLKIWLKNASIDLSN
jgi:hypothetical protein